MEQTFGAQLFLFVERPLLNPSSGITYQEARMFLYVWSALAIFLVKFGRLSSISRPYSVETISLKFKTDDTSCRLADIDKFLLMQI
jgi:hypothetical protein